MFYFVWMFDAYGESALASGLSAESNSAPLLLGFFCFELDMGNKDNTPGT